MNILLVSEYFPPKTCGGGEVSAYLLAKNLVKRGINVRVLTSYQKDTKRYENKDGIKIYRLLVTGKSPNSFKENIVRLLFFYNSTYNVVKKFVKKYNIDIVHSLNQNSIIGISRAKKSIKSKVVANINSPWVFCPKANLMKNNLFCTQKCSFLEYMNCVRSSKEIGKLNISKFSQLNIFLHLFIYKDYIKRQKALKEIDSFVATTEFIKNLLLNQGVYPNKVSVIPDIIEGSNNIKIKKTNEVPVILYLGSLTYFKGITILLDALRMIKLPYLCKIYGDGYLENYIVDYVQKYNLNVTLSDLVPHNEIHQIIANADILVFPSIIPEAYGRAILEANLVGKSVVVSSVGGSKELVVNNKTGLLVRSSDAFDLKEKIEYLIKNPDKREEMGSFAKSVVEKTYNGDVITKKIIDLYESL